MYLKNRNENTPTKNISMSSRADGIATCYYHLANTGGDLSEKICFASLRSGLINFQSVHNTIALATASGNMIRRLFGIINYATAAR
jgi:hypothetical protein